MKSITVFTIAKYEWPIYQNLWSGVHTRCSSVGIRRASGGHQEGYRASSVLATRTVKAVRAWAHGQRPASARSRSPSPTTKPTDARCCVLLLHCTLHIAHTMQQYYRKKYLNSISLALEISFKCYLEGKLYRRINDTLRQVVLCCNKISNRCFEILVPINWILRNGLVYIIHKCCNLNI